MMKNNEVNIWMNLKYIGIKKNIRNSFLTNNIFK